MASIQQALLAFPTAPPRTYATWNPSDTASTVTLSNGNLTFTANAENLGGTRATITKSSGKWYWEHIITTTTTIGYAFQEGVGVVGSSSDRDNGPQQSPGCLGYDNYLGNVSQQGAIYVYGETFGKDDVVGIALDMDTNTVAFYKNNAIQGFAIGFISGLTISPMIGGYNRLGISCDTNFGATPLTYVPPAGFNAGLYL